MRWTRVAGCVGLMLLALRSAGARQTGGPAVVHAEAPSCEIAFKFRISGWVLVRVTIDRQGKVTSSTVEHEQQPYTAQCSEAAAKNWIFVPSGQDEAREALLSFFFTGEERETDGPSHVSSSFDDPWTMRLARVKSTTLRLPRENGAIPEKRCPIHGEVMNVGLVPISGGRFVPEIPREPRKQVAKRAYQKAEGRLFPETNRIFRSCTSDEREAEMYYCQSCRDAEQKWLTRHPEWNPNEK
jgi:hypothetical protein